MSFSPLPEDEPPLTLPEFLHRLDMEPEFAAKMRAHYEAALAVPLSPETEQMHAAAGKALAALKHRQGIWHAKEALKKLEAILDDDGLSHEARVARFEGLAAEAVDHLLDTGEPERTRYITQINALRAELQKLGRL